MGAVLRYWLSGQLNSQWVILGNIQLGTMGVNVLGSALMGIIYVLMAERQLLPETLKPFVIVGLLGGFTTFSSFSLEAVQFFTSGNVVGAAIYVLLSVVLCLLALSAAMFLGRMIF